jgi:3-oxoacyl-[acyl-carrier protein] reductase
MGAAVSLALAREGAHLVLAGRDTAAIEPVAAEVGTLGRRALIVRCDVTNTAEVDAVAARAIEFGDGRVDILVNVAGGSGPIETPSWETTPDEFDQIVELNMKGCFLTMRALLPVMMERRYGKIVNVGGTFGLRGRALRMAYSASKWGLRGISKSAALEAGPYGININTVCPGMVEGPRFDRVCRENAKRLGISLDEARQRHAQEYALRRVSTREDVANAVVFLVSERSRQITGQDLAVDGGWVI